MYPREPWIAGRLIFVSVGGSSNPLEMFKQITCLRVLRRLDNLHMLEENKPPRPKLPVDRRVFSDSKGSNLTPLALQRNVALRVAAVEKLKPTHPTALAELAAIFASLQTCAFRGRP